MKTNRQANADEPPEPSHYSSPILRLEESVNQAAMLLEQLANGLDARTNGKTKQKRKASALVASLADSVFGCQQELLVRFQEVATELCQLMTAVKPSKYKLPPGGVSGN